MNYWTGCSLLLFTLFTSCATPDTGQLSFDDSVFRDSSTLLGTPIISDVSPSRLLSFGDLLLYGTPGSWLQVCRVFDLDQMRHLDAFIPHGSGDGELESIYSWHSRGDTLYVYDISLGRINQHEYSDGNWLGAPTISFKLKDASLADFAALGDGQFAGSPYDNVLQSKLVKFGRDGVLQETGLPYPYESGSQQYQKHNLPEVYYTSMCYSQAHDRLFMAYRNADRVEVYKNIARNVGELEKDVIGPYGYKAEFREVTSEGGDSFLDPIVDVTRHCYFSANCDDETVMVLYSGELMESSEPREPEDDLIDKVLVFNWEGEVITSYSLDPPIMGQFSVNFDRKEIYGISNVDDVKVYQYSFD